ncbi:hypothetical protein [Streptomyces sp. NPDC089799]|uniref:hypothetical protein n=1 Tax=Streptomyces sp. NPDC089799 TaxID=3155066 RepID=UPI003430A183
MTVVACGTAAAVLLAGCAEYAAELMVEDRIADALRPRLGATEVDAAGSGLLAVARGRVGTARVSGDEAQVGRISGASVRLTLTGIATGEDGRGGTVDSVEGRITVPVDAVRASLSAGGGGLPVSAVSTDPASGTVRLDVGPGGAATVRLRPELRHGRLSFTVVEATLLGRPAPERLVSAVREGLADRQERSAPDADAALPGMTAESVHVTDGGLDIEVRGRNVRLGGQVPRG